MHAHLIDWLRKIHFNADTALATQRWKLAEHVAEEITRKELLQLLRAFLFSPVAAELEQSLTQQFLVEKEFPATNNVEDVRLQAGIVMVAAFERRTVDADAFALGVKASDFPKNRCQPAQTGIVDEALNYLAVEANLLRPSDFGERSAANDVIEKFKALVTATVGADGKAIDEAGADLSKTFYEVCGREIQRLAEETGLLWWLLCGPSLPLARETAALDAEAYALVAAAEAAERTQLLPPPPSIYAILRRALAPCKLPENRTSTLKDCVASADPEWRSRFVAAHPVTDCADLVPLLTALKITDDAGDTETLAKLLPKACHGAATDLPLPPGEAARQLYNELMFLKALKSVS